MKNVEQMLFAIADPEYCEFQAKLVPTVEPDSIIGVRVPEIRKLAKLLSGAEKAEFISELPHCYYDENMLHAAIISEIRDFDSAVYEVERFLPYVDNWAVCDAVSPNVFKKHTSELLPKILGWIASEKTYTVRYGIGALMRYYLDESFEPRFLDIVANVKSDEYYIKMMAAWYFATALAKQWDSAVKIIEERKLEPWTNNKAIQKAKESFRVPPEHKEYLNKLKIN